MLRVVKKTKRVEEVNAHTMSVKSISRRRPNGQSDDKDDSNKGYGGEEAAPGPLLFSFAHVSDKLSAFLSGLCWFPVGRRTKGDAEDERSKDPENRENYQRANKSRWRKL